MIDKLRALKESGGTTSFVIGGVPNNPINGKVLEVTPDTLIIETDISGTTFRYLMHPDNAVIVEKI